jgi:hypothetical protein
MVLLLPNRHLNFGGALANYITEGFSMRALFQESITTLFNDGLVAVTKGDFVRMPVTAISLQRNYDLDLIFELTSRGWSEDKRDTDPAGTVRYANEIIEFAHIAGGVGIARGVIPRGTTTSHSIRQGEAETVETFSAASVEMDFQNKAPRLT